ncbi:hypothetical protein [Marinobacter changyiensis]|uniref:hypothetical protein n=1 Tax=Marinobacter changyiensis TaxID=2604091 RepID=UPI001263F478|nr:hypothetical protein [Marinobacter changyiensis]
MNLVTFKRTICLALLTAFMSGRIIAAPPLTPESYVTIDLSAQAVTVEGIYQRLVRLQKSPYDDEDQLRVGQLVQSEVGLIFQEYGVTQTEFLKYGAQHESEINQWLQENPSAAREYDALEQRRTSLSTQIRAIKE